MAMGLLVRFWVGLAEARQSNIESVLVSVSVLIFITEQAILLMSQTNSTISYHLSKLYLTISYHVV